MNTKRNWHLLWIRLFFFNKDHNLVFTHELCQLKSTLRRPGECQAEYDSPLYKALEDLAALVIPAAAQSLIRQWQQPELQCALELIQRPDSSSLVNELDLKCSILMAVVLLQCSVQLLSLSSDAWAISVLLLRQPSTTESLWSCGKLLSLC